VRGSQGKLTAKLPRWLFAVSCLGLAWALGVLAVKRDWFPYPHLVALAHEARQGLGLIGDSAGITRPWWYADFDGEASSGVVHDRAAVAPGLTLILGMDRDNELLARVVDPDGHVVHEWVVDWFDLAPDTRHLPERRVPESPPGAQIHGAVLTTDGHLVFNFDELAMVRLDGCGQPEWTLPVRTHHSLIWDEDTGSFWTSSLRSHAEPGAEFPNHRGSFVEYLVAQVSPDGRLLREISLVDLLEANGLAGLLYLSTTHNRGTAVSGDTLHVNDVELFPATMSPGFFTPGDMMVSFRNINAVVVFEAETYRAKFLSIGTMLRQHDPDFVDGNTISVFDNNNLHPLVKGAQSRIIRIRAPDNIVETVYAGSEETPFFTNIMGKHQLLGNGNMLITESRRGRAFEVTADGRVVWEYFNEVEDGVVGLLSEAQRLAPRFDVAFFETLAAACAGD
jgi:hypothetical protein